MEAALPGAGITPSQVLHACIALNAHAPAPLVSLLTPGAAHSPCLVLLCPHIRLVSGATELECPALVNCPHWVLGLRAGWSQNFKGEADSAFVQVDLKFKWVVP